MKILLKKLFCLAIVLCMILSMVACSENEDAEEQSAPEENGITGSNQNDKSSDSGMSDDTSDSSEETQGLDITPINCDINKLYLREKTIYLTETMADLFEEFMLDREYTKRFYFQYEDDESGIYKQGIFLHEDFELFTSQLITDTTKEFEIRDVMRIYFEESVGTPLLDAKIVEYCIEVGSFYLYGTEYEIGATSIDVIKGLGMELISENVTDYSGSVTYALNGDYNRVTFDYDRNDCFCKHFC